MRDSVLREFRPPDWHGLGIKLGCGRGHSRAACAHSQITAARSRSDWHQGGVSLIRSADPDARVFPSSGTGWVTTDQADRAAKKLHFVAARASAKRARGKI